MKGKNNISNYAITRIEKLKGSAAIAGVEKHNERKKSSYKSNPDINSYRTPHNYHLIAPSQSYNNFIKKRLEETNVKKIRKDSVIFQDAIVTASPEFFEGKSPELVRNFFEHALSFYTNKFGRENIMSAVVHVDEKTPHMHFAFVPITKDGRLSSKELIGGPKGLRQLQDDFYVYMHEEFKDLDRGISKKETKREHLPTDVYKCVADLTSDLQDFYKVLDGMTLLDMKERKKYLLENFSLLKPNLEKVSYMLKASENSVDEVRELKKAAYDTRSKLEKKINDQQHDYTKENDELKRQVKDLNKLLGKYMTAIGNLPEYYQSRVIYDVSQAEITRNTHMGYER